MLFKIYIFDLDEIYIDMLDKGYLDSYINVIPPFGTILLKFGPAYRYSCSMQTVDMTKLIWDHKPGQIILSTNQGKIKVRKIRTGWSPTTDYFRNYGTQCIRQFKFYTLDSVYRNGSLENKAIDFSSYGDQVKYLVSLKVGGRIVEYRIFAATQKQVAAFENLRFTEQNLATVFTTDYYSIFYK